MGQSVLAIGHHFVGARAQMIPILYATLLSAAIFFCFNHFDSLNGFTLHITHPFTDIYEANVMPNSNTHEYIPNTSTMIPTKRCASICTCTWSRWLVTRLKHNVHVAVAIMLTKLVQFIHKSVL